MAVFQNRGQVVQTFCAAISAIIAVLSAYHKLPQPKWIFTISTALFVLFVAALVKGVRSSNAASSKIKVLDSYFILHKDLQKAKFPQVTTDAKIVNVGDEPDVHSSD